MTSYPGLSYMTFDTLPDSAVPQQLRDLRYDVVEDGEGERILPAGITERFARDADGQLSPITQESTRAVAETRLHAGINTVKRYAFEMP